jgi:hypothetical protein
MSTSDDDTVIEVVDDCRGTTVTANALLLDRTFAPNADLRRVLATTAAAVDDARSTRSPGAEPQSRAPRAPSNHLFSPSYMPLSTAPFPLLCALNSSNACPRTRTLDLSSFGVVVHYIRIPPSLVAQNPKILEDLFRPGLIEIFG